MNKVQYLSIVAVIATISMTGCGRKSGSGEKVDTSKAQLTISTFDGGVGDQWLKNAARAFEKANENRDDFEENKVGVQIHITMDRSAHGEYLINAPELDKDMYFTENVDYYTLANQGKLADITDILTAANSEDGGKKIIDKIDSNLLDFMNRGGKYYAVPFYDCFYGLVYDKDLFKEKAFYMKNDGTFTNKESEFGTGPNGVAGDWDDGLPRTYAEFDKMMDKMRNVDVIPFTYSSGIATEYPARALASWWSDDEGYEDINLNYTFNGTAHNIVKSITDGVVTTETVNITKDNGYKLRSQAGIYNALHFARDILTKTANNYRSYYSNYDVQTAFVTNKIYNKDTIGMMFEGTWWENEAANAFDEARTSGVDEFHYGFMPIPKSDESKIGDATLMNLNESFGFISSTSSHMKLAKEFFSFLHTDAQLREFTLETNMTRGLDYTFDASQRSQITSFANDLISIKESAHAKVVYPYSGLKFFVDHAEIFDNKVWSFGTKAYGTNPIITFIDNKSLTAEQYFNDHRTLISESDWKDLVK